LVKITNSCGLQIAEPIVQLAESSVFWGFSKLARSLQTTRHLRNIPQALFKRRNIKMTQSTFSRRFAAAFSALMLSAIAVGGTVTVPAPAQAHTLYVGEVA